MLTFILVSVDNESVGYVYDKIVQLAGDNLNKIFIVFGEYDILFKYKSNRPEEVNDLLRDVKQINGVQYLKTAVVAHKTKSTDVLSNDPRDRVIQHH